MNPTQGGWLILLTVLAAMLAAIVHLPESWPQWLGWWRPLWVPMVVLFWVMQLPHRLGLIVAWLIGLALDVLAGDPLGLNGAILASITWLTWRLYERLRMYALLQQCGYVFVVGAAVEVFRGLVLGWVRGTEFSAALLLGPLVSAFVWPFLYLVLQELRLRFRVQ